MRREAGVVTKVTWSRDIRAFFEWFALVDVMSGDCCVDAVSLTEQLKGVLPPIELGIDELAQESDAQVSFNPSYH